MKNWRLGVLGAALAALTGCAAVTATDDVKKPTEQRSGFMGMGVADEIKVEREGPFKGVEKVAIASFKVGFVHGKVESRRAGRGFGGNATAGIELSGIDEAMMQAITDAAYEDFIARMAQAGYTVVPRQELQAQADFAKAKPEESPQRKSGSFFGDPTDITTFAPSSHGNMYWFDGESINNGGGFGFANATTAAMTQYGKTGIKVLSVYYVIDFAGADGYGGAFRTSAGVQVGQALTLAPGGGVTIMGGEGRVVANHFSHIKLGQPMYAEEKFGTMVQTTSDVAKGVETGVNVVRAVAGIGTNQRRDFEVQADAERYSALSKDLLIKANTQLVERMASLR